MSSIGKEVKVADVGLDPSTVITQRMLIVTVKASEIIKTWGDYTNTTWANVSALTW